MVRFIPKQFAENSTTSVVFGSFQEQGGNVGDGTISSDPATLQGGTAWPLGWSAATDNFFKIPRGEEMEGLERVLSAAIIQQFTDGLTFWQSEMPVTQYQTIVQYQTGSDLPKLYVNITGTSTSTPPDSDATNWFMFLDTGASNANVDLSNLSSTGEDHFVTKNTAQTITGAKTFRGTVTIDNNFASGGSAIVFDRNGTTVGRFYYYDGMDFALTDSAGTGFLGLRIKTQSATDNSKYGATTEWVRSSNVKTPNYNSSTYICDQSNYSTNFPYTCTANGWIILKTDVNSWVYLQVNSGEYIRAASYNISYFKVANGDVLTYSTSNGTWSISFCPDR